MDRLATLIHRSSREKSALCGAEVGVSKGATSRMLLATFPELHLYMIDSWASYEIDHPYRKSGDQHAKLSADQQVFHKLTAIRATSFASDRRTILHMDSITASNTLMDDILDFCFIDGDHTFEAVKADIEAFWPKIAAGGVLCGHDIDHPRDKRGIWGVRRAVTFFSSVSGRDFRTDADLWWIVKPPKCLAACKKTPWEDAA